MHNGLTVVTFQLTDVPSGAGGLIVIPGSHKSNYPCPKNMRLYQEHQEHIRQLVCNAGDVAIFTEAVTHGTLPWTAEHPRRSILTRYTAGNMAYVPAYEIPEWANERQRAVMETPLSFAIKPSRIRNVERFLMYGILDCAPRRLRAGYGNHQETNHFTYPQGTFKMSTSTSAILGLIFLGLANASVFLMFKLWGYPFDKETHTSAAPRSLMLLHRLIGYAYAILYVFMMWHMVPRLWNYQVELPPSNRRAPDARYHHWRVNPRQDRHPPIFPAL